LGSRFVAGPIIAKAIGSNEFAAQLAASSAASQLDKYFRVVQQVAKDEKFLAAFKSMLQNEELAKLREQLSDPNENGSDANEKRRKTFLDHPARQGLQPILQKLLDDPDGEYPESASWFVTDRSGNQIAAVFEGESETSTIGKNYSFRTYFTGFPSDLKNENGEVKYPVGSDGETRPVINQPHLSASFLSDASGLRKVAFSTPIRDGDQKVIGIVAVTANLGKLVDFDDSFDHYVMLVDDRIDETGANRGIVLEHPLFKIARKQSIDQHLPPDLAKIKVDLKQLTKNESGVDPLGNTKIGRIHQFDREFIVAKEEVGKKKRNESTAAAEAEVKVTGKDGIFVVALEDYDSVIQPSKELSARLGRLAILAFCILVSVAIGMWLLVTRMFRESGRRLVGLPEGSTMATFGSTSHSTAQTDMGSTSRPSELKK